MLALLIRFLLLIMDWPINLDCKAFICAIEVQNKRTNGLLPPEFTIVQLSVS
ncbi:hypothetical protein VZO05_10370 [Aggregatilineales bacterium SYSU G02658]